MQEVGLKKKKRTGETEIQSDFTTIKDGLEWRGMKRNDL